MGIFDLDVAKYGDLSMVMDEYLSKEFKDRYDYPLHSFIFHSSATGYVCGMKNSANYFQWKQDDFKELIYPITMFLDSVLGKINHLGKCVDCRSSISGNMYECFQCGPNYNLCGQCTTNGTHPPEDPGHVIILTSKPNVIVEEKVDAIPPILLKKLEALEVTTKEQGAKLRRVVDRLTRDENSHPSSLLEKKQTVEDILHLDGTVPGLASTRFDTSWALVDDGESFNSSSYFSSLSAHGSFNSTEEETKVPRQPSEKMMIAMELQVQEGWLTRLLEMKGGDITKVLNALKGNSS